MPLVVERCELEGLELAVSKEFLIRRTTRSPRRWRARRGSARTSSTTRMTRLGSRPPVRRPGSSASTRSSRSRRSSKGCRSCGAGGSRRRRSTSRSARRGAPCTRCSTASRGRCGSSPRRGPSASGRFASSIPSCASSSTRRATGTTRSSQELAELDCVDVVDFKEAYDLAGAEPYRRAEPLSCDRRCPPQRADRGPRAERPREGGDPGAAPRPDHVGRADPLGRGRRRAPVPAEDAELEAVALRLAERTAPTSTTPAPSAGSRSTAAASSSSARDAARSSTSRRSSTRTRRTTSRRPPTTGPRPASDLPGTPAAAGPGCDRISMVAAIAGRRTVKGSVPNYIHPRLDPNERFRERRRQVIVKRRRRRLAAAVDPARRRRGGRRAARP